MELVGVTEKSALASARWLGLQKKNEVDEIAAQSMRALLDKVPMKGTVVIGKGEMNEAPMLYISENLGTGVGPYVGEAVNSLEGADILASKSWSPMSVLAVADQGNLLQIPNIYMDKIAVGKEAAGKIDMEAPVIDNLLTVAKAKGKDIEDLVVCILDRERHTRVIEEVRKSGVKIKLFPVGDIGAAISTAFHQTGVDVLIGSGRASDGVLAAIALKGLGGDFEGKLLPQNEGEINRCKKMGILDVDRIYRMYDIVKGDDAIFVATGVTDGELLQGVQFKDAIGTTHSLVIQSKSGKVCFVEGEHNLTMENLLINRKKIDYSIRDRERLW